MRGDSGINTICCQQSSCVLSHHVAGFVFGLVFFCSIPRSKSTSFIPLFAEWFKILLACSESRSAEEILGTFMCEDEE